MAALHITVKECPVTGDFAFDLLKIITFTFLFQTCPVCFKTMSSAVVDIHANMCASEMFGD